MDIVQRSLPEPELLALEGVERIERDIVFRVRSRRTPRCPSCSGSEVSYHSTYVRRLRDLPWQGQPVQIQVKTRRLRCRNRTGACPETAQLFPPESSALDASAFPAPIPRSNQGVIAHTRSYPPSLPPPCFNALRSTETKRRAPSPAATRAVPCSARLRLPAVCATDGV